ncbi:hypothetical protein MNV49_000730 [Pseudohyphozyma bogoriensis]|nr:hypothetical protein MNV49_000730 [Pseudohyphozyma bogoriensis]
MPEGVCEAECAANPLRINASTTGDGVMISVHVVDPPKTTMGLAEWQPLHPGFQHATFWRWVPKGRQTRFIVHIDATSLEHPLSLALPIGGRVGIEVLKKVEGKKKKQKTLPSHTVGMVFLDTRLPAAPQPWVVGVAHAFAGRGVALDAGVFLTFKEDGKKKKLSDVPLNAAPAYVLSRKPSDWKARKSEDIAVWKVAPGVVVEPMWWALCFQKLTAFVNVAIPDVNDARRMAVLHQLGNVRSAGGNEQELNTQLDGLSFDVFLADSLPRHSDIMGLGPSADEVYVFKVGISTGTTVGRCI